MCATRIGGRIFGRAQTSDCLCCPQRTKSSDGCVRMKVFGHGLNTAPIRLKQPFRCGPVVDKGHFDFPLFALMCVWNVSHCCSAPSQHTRVTSWKACAGSRMFDIGVIAASQRRSAEKWSGEEISETFWLGELPLRVPHSMSESQTGAFKVNRWKE